MKQKSVSGNAWRVVLVQVSDVRMASRIPLVTVLTLLTASTSAPALRQPAPQPSADTVLDAYVSAIGGAAAIERITSRIVRGHFDNGRGLKAPFVVYAKAPDKLVTVIGSEAIESREGSGRGYDGRIGWDKNFIGTGLRVVTGIELADLVRDADLHRPLHWRALCPERSLDERAGPDGAGAVVVRCGLAEGRIGRLYFDGRSGLLLRYDSPMWSGDGFVSIYYEDYRLVDGVRVPFRTRSQLPGAVTVFAVESVRHNEPIDDRVFARPGV